MPSEKELLVRWFYRAELDPGVLSFDELLERAAVEALGKSQLDAEAYVVTNAPRIWNEVRTVSSEDFQQGRIPLCAVVDHSARRAIWTHHLETVQKCDRRRHSRARSRPEVLRAIDALSHREYEAAGCTAAILAGADRYHLTPGGNEGGVDFFARIKQPSLCHVFSGSGAPLRIIGQSKKYQSRVDVQRMRDFLKTLDNVRHASRVIEDIVPNWFRDTGGPVIGWVVAHSGYQSGATTIARDHGVVLSTSLDLAEIVVQSRKIYEVSIPQGRVNQFRMEITKLLG